MEEDTEHHDPRFPEKHGAGSVTAADDEGKTDSKAEHDNALLSLLHDKVCTRSANTSDYKDLNRAKPYSAFH